MGCVAMSPLTPKAPSICRRSCSLLSGETDCRWSSAHPPLHESSAAACCEKTPTRIARFRRTSPTVGCSVPARRPSSVLFPSPLRPTTAVRHVAPKQSSTSPSVAAAAPTCVTPAPRKSANGAAPSSAPTQSAKPPNRSSGSPHARMGAAVILPCAHPPSLLLSAPTRMPCFWLLNFLPSLVFSSPIRPSFFCRLATCRSLLLSPSLALLPEVPLLPAASFRILSTLLCIVSFFFVSVSTCLPSARCRSALSSSNDCSVPL
mmetsp:Transcript_6250/g.21958  ORF Transcript_6250/g.21958 Transcript_6250/m.21958 type:complete len:261 (+) Transcript_6250:749-1531(+)